MKGRFQVRDKRVLITGGSGVVGSAIAALAAADRPKEIVILDNFTRGRRRNLDRTSIDVPMRVIEADIRDARAVASAMAGVDIVFHQAAIRITQCVEEPRLALEVMVDGTYNVVEAAANAGVSKVIAASSAAVYGAATEYPTPEEHHLYANTTLYGAAKIFNEQLLRSFHHTHGLDYIALRYFNVYGPGMDIEGVHTEVLVRWMKAIATGEPPLILGTGSQTLDMIYVDDVARANVLAAKSDVTDRIINVGSGLETTLNELAETLIAVMDGDLIPTYGPERAVAVNRRLADTEAARSLIGFEASVPIEDGLGRLVDWWRTQNTQMEASIA
jgi:UDP-glucose 4-epimerase